jgi:anti-anti-sigma regulatory factor
MKGASPIFTKRFESYIWIRPEGRGTLLESPIIKDLVEGSAADGVSNFVVDLEACPGMDSTFMGMLAGLGIGFRKNKEGEISIVGTTEKTKSSLKELGLQHLMVIEPTEGVWLEKIDDIREELVLFNQEREVDREAHILECHEDLCVADEDNLSRFRAVLEMLGSDMAPKASTHQKDSD